MAAQPKPIRFVATYDGPSQSKKQRTLAAYVSTCIVISHFSHLPRFHTRRHVACTNPSTDGSSGATHAARGKPGAMVIALFVRLAVTAARFA